MTTGQLRDQSLREHSLAIQCDLALSIGGESGLSPLLHKALQGLLFHSGFTIALLLRHAIRAMSMPSPETKVPLILEAGLGQSELIPWQGTRLDLPAGLLSATPCSLSSPFPPLPSPLAPSSPLAAILSLPIAGYGHILLLLPAEVSPTLPPDDLVEIFTPILPHLANAITLCRSYEGAHDVRRRILEEVVEQSPVSIVVTDDQGTIEYVNEAFSYHTGYAKDEAVGQNPRILQGGATTPEEYVAMWEILTQGDTWCGEFHNRRKDGSLFWERAVIAPVRDEQGTISHFVGVKQDVSEEKQRDEDLRESVERLDRVIRQTVAAFARATVHTDPYTAGHESRVAHLCVRLGHRLGLSEHARQGLELAAKSHDIGQIKIPAEILLRPRKLTPLEFEFIKQHPEVGWEIFRHVDFPWPIADIIRQHHENYDGSGYPHGLAGEEILQEARILRVADMAESLSSHRPFRSAFTRDEVLGHLLSG